LTGSVGCRIRPRNRIRFGFSFRGLPLPIRSGEPLHSISTPKQRRSLDTLNRLLEAAEALIDEKGLADVSVPEIAARAGSSVGGFYARFRDKAELLRALEERFFAQKERRVEELALPERWQGASLPEIVRVCMDELVGTFRLREPLIRAFLLRAAHDAELVGVALRFRRRTSERIGALLLTRREEIAHPEPALAIDVGVQLAFALMHECALFGEVRAAGRTLSDCELAAELTRIVLGYLGVAQQRNPV
jgi:AcrR family transcriptional regulator